MCIIVVKLIIFIFLSIFFCLVSPPVVRPLPQRSVAVGRSLRLKCGLERSAFPPPTISWYKDGERVNSDAGDHTVLLPGGSLFFLRTLHNHRARDSGRYSCRAENQEGVVYSQTATLTVTCKYYKNIGFLFRSFICPAGSYAQYLN